MEDLATLESKSLKELREIAKAFGIVSDKLSKRTIIKLIAGGGSEEQEQEQVQSEPTAEPATESTEPKRRGRKPRKAEKVETATAESVEPVESAEPQVQEPEAVVQAEES